MPHSEVQYIFLRDCVKLAPESDRGSQEAKFSQPFRDIFPPRRIYSPFLACFSPTIYERAVHTGNGGGNRDEEAEAEEGGESFSRCIGGLHGMACTEYVGFLCAYTVHG